MTHNEPQPQKKRRIRRLSFPDIIEESPVKRPGVFIWGVVAHLFAMALGALLGVLFSWFG